MAKLEVIVTRQTETKVPELPGKVFVEERPVTVSEMTDETTETNETSKEGQDISYRDRRDQELIFWRSNISPPDRDNRALITAERLGGTITSMNTVPPDTTTFYSETEAELRDLYSSYWYGETLNFSNTARKQKRLQQVISATT